MTIAVANNSNSTSWAFVLARINDLAGAMSTKVITTDSNTTSGNAVLVGTLQANNLVADNISANGATLIISSNSVFSGSISVGNTSVNTSVNSTAITSGRAIIGGTITGNSTTLAVGANVILSTSLISVGNSTVNVSINSSSVTFNGVAEASPTFTVANIAASTTVVDYFDNNTYRGSEYVLSVQNNTANGYQLSKILVLQDGSSNNAYMSEYGIVVSNNVLGVFSANSNSTHTKVYFTLAGSVTDVRITGVRNPVVI